MPRSSREIGTSQRYWEAMWQRPGSNAVQRPTSLVWVARVATSSSTSARCARQKSAKAAATSSAPGGPAVTPRSVPRGAPRTAVTVS